VVGRIRHLFLRAFSLALAALPTAAAAQDLPPFDWSGFYAGVHGGAGLDLANVEDPFGPSIFGDTVRTTGLLGGAQAGYNWQLGAAVVGLEADVSLADMYGTNTCFAYSGFYVSSYCTARIDALGTVAGRLGWALPGDRRTLLYGKGGLAWAHDRATAYPNRPSLTSSTRTSGLLWGWVLGGGIERALNRRWSLKTEYDFLQFDQGFAAPESRYQASPGTLTPVPETATEISHDVQQVKIGLNYRFGDGAMPPDPAWGTRPDGSAPPPAGTLIEAGVRYVRGWARLQRDQLRPAKPDITQSKLTYEGIPSNGTEAFARLDTPFDIMVKGILGTGSGNGGTKRDEDWSLNKAVYIPYSNTASFPTYDIHYLTADAGYDVWRTPDTKVALFAGYSYFKQAFVTYGCRQIADPNNDCAGSEVVPTTVLGQSDTDTWRSLRLGAALDTMIMPGLKLVGDIAYLPYVKLTAVNHHFLKHEESPEWGDGSGVQLEAILSYALVDQFSVGVGARYWSLWATGATERSGSSIPMHFAAEQAALLVQGSYTFDTASP